MLATIVGYVLLVLGGIGMLCNWSIIVTAVITRPPRGGSLVPIVGGLFAFVGCALIPALGWKLGLLALVLDPFTWLMLAWPVLALRSR